MAKNAGTPTAKVTSDEIASFILSSNMDATREALALSLTRRRTATNSMLLLEDVIAVVMAATVATAIVLVQYQRGRLLLHLVTQDQLWFILSVTHRFLRRTSGR